MGLLTFGKDVWGAAGDVLRTVAPALGTAVAGPFGGMAVRAITGALLGEESEDEGAAVAAVRAATPEQLAVLRRIDTEFQSKMEALGVDLEEIAAADRAHARDTNRQTGTIVPAVLAAVVMAGFFGVLGALVTVEIPYTGEQAVNIMLGVLGASVTQVFNYYFGSSRGSATKGVALEGLAARAGSAGK
jgi:hypothetical protein